MAKADGFLKIYTGVGAGGSVGTLRGESLDSLFAEAIAISDFDVGSADSEAEEILNPTDKAGNKVSAQYAKFGFKITKECDRASPYLFKAYCLTFSKRKVEKQNLFAVAEVTFRKAGGPKPVEFLTLSFGGVIVTSYSLSVDDDGMTKETVGFRFQACDMVYAQQTPAGTQAPPPEKKGWSYAVNERQ